MPEALLEIQSLQLSRAFIANYSQTFEPQAVSYMMRADCFAMKERRRKYEEVSEHYIVSSVCNQSRHSRDGKHALYQQARARRAEANSPGGSQRRTDAPRSRTT